jgi:hypothetical protein
MIVILSFHIKISPSTLAQPVPKRLYALDWADPLIPRRRKGKRLHHGGDVCGIVVLGLIVLSVLFLL